MKTDKRYVGIDDDVDGAMTHIGTIIRDAWVFGLIPETETCKDWDLARIQALYDQVDAAWEPYGHLVSLLPAELRERHARIYDAAVARARGLGWSPNMEEG